MVSVLCQSPLSRAIKELEEDLGAQLFIRTTRSTKLTRAGRMFLEYVPRIFASLHQARDSVKTPANGFNSQLRNALSDCITPSCFSALLALCRQEEPEIEIDYSCPSPREGEISASQYTSRRPPPFSGPLDESLLRFAIQQVRSDESWS